MHRGTPSFTAICIYVVVCDGFWVALSVDYGW